MADTIDIPIWLLVVLSAGTLYAVAISMLFPGMRWFVRRRLDRAIEELNSRLQIRIRPFQRTKRQALIERLVHDPQVVAYIEADADSKEIPISVLEARVYKYAGEIIPAFNAIVYFRIGCWIARRVSRFLYRVRVSAADPDKLAEVDADATVVFVMNHRSNMDYLLVSYVAAGQVSLSYAVGEWARVFPLKSLIKALGGFFVRRNSKNPLYRKVLERYIHMSTQEGVCQAVYLEGGLSRDGTMGRPKLGFLDYMLRHFDADTGRDIVFVPIGINYDHVLEDLNLLSSSDPDSERRGVVFHTRNLLRFLWNNMFIGSRIRWRRFGYASVNFGIPVSAREFCRSNALEFNKLDRKERFQAVEQLADQLMAAIQHVMPILPIPVISTVFANHPGMSFKSLDILAKSGALIDKLIAGGAAMRPSEKPRNRTMVRSLEQMKVRQMLVEENDVFKVNQDAVQLIEYYANSLNPWLSSR